MLGLPLLVWRAPIVTIADLDIHFEIHFICLRQLSNLYADSLIPMLQSHSQGRWHRGCWRSFWSLFLPQFLWSHLTGWMHLSRAGSHTYPWKNYASTHFSLEDRGVSNLSMKWMWSGCVNWLLQIVIWGEPCSKCELNNKLYKFKMKNIKPNLIQNFKFRILPAPTTGLHFSLRGQI